MSASRKKWEYFRNIQPTLDISPLLPINKYEFFYERFPPQVEMFSNSWRDDLIDDLKHFQLGCNTLFYMLPCLFHLIIFSLFQYTRQEANAWKGSKFSMSNFIFHFQCFFSLEMLRDKRGGMSYVVGGFDDVVLNAFSRTLWKFRRICHRNPLKWCEKEDVKVQ